MPKLSILVFSHARPHELERFMKQLEEQSYKDYEVIILDEDEERHSEKYHNPDKNVYSRLLEHNHDWGYTSREIVAPTAKGEWLWMPNTDHQIKPEFLEKMLEKATEKPETVMVLCNFSHRTLGRVTTHPSIGCCDIGTYIVRKELFLEFGFSPKDLVADGRLAQNVAKVGRVAYVREHLVHCP